MKPAEPKQPTGSGERGFAMLLVFVMAAAAGILLYEEMPRLVFESQRILEQDLIDRGEEYQRAIQLYVRKYKKYPADLDELENEDVRFLRRRYKDPLTGEDEWRLIHIDNMGVYTDSLIHEASDEEEADKSVNTFITERAAFGSTEITGEGAQGGATVTGASDRPVATADQYYGTTPVQTSTTQQGIQQGVVPGQNIVAVNPLIGVVPGLPNQGNVQAGTVVPNPNYPVNTIPDAEQTDTDVQVSGPTAGIGVPGLPATGYSAQTPTTQQTTVTNPAVGLIQQILTQPRVGGITGITTSQQSGTVTGGVAGVASRAEGEAIKEYNERTKYQEWEFLYNSSEDQTATATGRGTENPGTEQDSSTR